MKYLIATLLFSSILFFSCSESDDISNPVLALNKASLTQDYLSNINNQSLSNNIDSTSLTNEKIALGRALFYDKALSVNSTISCATCHKQEFAFGDNTAFSKGFDNRLTPRNSPTLLNTGSSNSFFWDLSVNRLVEQVVMPLTNHIEMGFPNEESFLERFDDLEYYKPLIKEAYNVEEADMLTIADAIAQFVISINSFDAKFDEVFEFNEIELLGRELFVSTGCNNCHGVLNQGFDGQIEPLQNGYSGGTPSSGSSANIGLDFNPKDLGGGDGRFKIPSLRNLSYSAPYMHDGRFNTLDEVIEHYNSGVKNSEHLDSRLRKSENGQVKKLNLSNLEKEAILSFLKTLDDDVIVNNTMYEDPFKD